jgi:hypothetical protein
MALCVIRQLAPSVAVASEVAKCFGDPCSWWPGACARAISFFGGGGWKKHHACMGIPLVATLASDLMQPGIETVLPAPSYQVTQAARHGGKGF